MVRSEEAEPTPGPFRTCVGCRSRRPQSELIRLHLDDGRRVRVDRHGPGRGAWLCRDDGRVCLAGAIDRKAFHRAFRTAPDPDSIRELLDVRWPSR